MATRRTTMSTFDTSAKSPSQETVSNFDTKVEERLKALEEKAHTPCSAGSDSEKVAALEKKLDALIAHLKTVMSLPL